MTLALDHFRLITAATRELVAEVGGGDKAARLIGKSEGQVSKYGNPDPAQCPATMPIGDVLTLELFVGKPVVTRQLAECQGVKVATADDAPPRGGLIGAHSAVAREFGELCAAVAEALADGHVSLNDMNRIIAEAHDLEEVIRSLRGAAAAAAGGGGAAVIGLHRR